MTINFMAGDFSPLEPWNDSMVSVRILESIFIIIVTVLLLNVLIALLNLAVGEAAKKVCCLPSPICLPYLMLYIEPTNLDKTDGSHAR